MTRFAQLVVVAFASCVALGCNPPCETSDSEPVSYDGGTHADGVYESSAIDGQYLHFPGGRRYALRHGLDAKPAVVQVYVAFEEYPLKENNISPAAGNQAVIEIVDDLVVQVRNDTCDELYVRVVASGGSPSDAGAD
jgi:hypothetical protein